MPTLTLLRDNLAIKAKALEEAEARLRDEPPDAAAWLQARLADQEFVLFCGAGISIPPPSSAPAFVSLTNSLLLALVDLLVERSLLHDAHRMAVEMAVEELGSRADLEVPPEVVFEYVRDAMGFDVVSRLLAVCLGRGEPNENHVAIRRLIGTTGSRLTGIITPNFDLYIERALKGIALRRTVVDSVGVRNGFPLCKPHGSLDRPDSIAITIDRISRPLKGAARQIFEELIAGSTVVIIGYSGWDYDLFPLLVHAGREWDTEVVWLLYDDTSMNERTAKIKLALGDRCTIVNGRRRALLPVLAGVDGRRSGPHHEELRQAFASVLRAETDDALIAAVIPTLTPAGVPESAGVVQRLYAELLRIAESNEIEDDAKLLKLLGLVVEWSEDDPPTRLRAAQLAVECASRLGRELAVLEFQRVVEGEEERDDPEAHLRRVEHKLRTFPFACEDDPEPALCERSIRTALRIDQAALLADLKRESEAEALAQQILNDTTFPGTGVSKDAFIVSDGYQRWRLHRLLGKLAAQRRDIEEVQVHFCEALDILWQELELWELGSALQYVASAVRRWDRKCVEAAMDLRVRIDRYSQDPNSELNALIWKLHYGVGTHADVKRAEDLLKDLRIDADDHKRYVRKLQRLRGAARGGGPAP